MINNTKKIKEIYEKFLETPNSKKAKQLLHTTFTDKSYLLRGEEYE